MACEYVNRGVYGNYAHSYFFSQLNKIMLVIAVEIHVQKYGSWNTNILRGTRNLVYANFNPLAYH